MKPIMTTEMTTEIKDLFAVRHLARYMAKKRVQAELRDQGIRVTLVKPAEISRLANDYLAKNPDLYNEAFARFQRWKA